jgi:hypothetical protein
VVHETLAAGNMTRDQLVAEYDRLCRLLEKAGLEPVVSSAVLDVFSDAELGALISYAAFRLVRLGRLET